MEKLAKKLASKISSSLGYDDEKEAVVAYGLIAIIQISVTTLLVLLLGLLVGVPAEALIVCFSVSILRKFSGGAHAGTAEFCTLFTVVYCTLSAYISRLLSGVYSPVLMGMAIFAVFGLSVYFVNKLAPVDSPNKPIRTEKKKAMRTGSFVVLVICFILSVMFYFLSSKIEEFKSYGISLLFGIFWQTFTLTPLGAQFIEKMNQSIKL